VLTAGINIIGKRRVVKRGVKMMMMTMMMMGDRSSLVSVIHAEFEG